MNHVPQGCWFTGGYLGVHLEGAGVAYPARQAHGKHYFWHHPSGETQWEMPPASKRHGAQPVHSAVAEAEYLLVMQHNCGKVQSFEKEK